MYRTKIFYTASFEGKKEYQKYYDLVLKIILDTKAELISTELGNYKTLLTKQDLKNCKTPEEAHYRAIKKGIQWADLVILELSDESFQVGHEATIALEMNKYVLGISLNIDWSKRIVNRYFTGVKYTKYNAREIITDFINQHSDEALSERFNLFLSKRQLEKLENLAQKENINKSQLLRSLIEKDL